MTVIEKKSSQEKSNLSIMSIKQKLPAVIRGTEPKGNTAGRKRIHPHEKRENRAVQCLQAVTTFSGPRSSPPSY